jgi:hypothetical protein
MHRIIILPSFSFLFLSCHGYGNLVFQHVMALGGDNYKTQLAYPYGMCVCMCVCVDEGREGEKDIEYIYICIPGFPFFFMHLCILFLSLSLNPFLFLYRETPSGCITAEVFPADVLPHVYSGKCG